MRFPALGALLLVLAACSTTSDRAPETAPQKPAPDSLLPKPPTAGINDGLSDLEYVWHLRSALNVAALSCGKQDGSIVLGYNSFLKQHPSLLNEAYSHEQKQTAGNAGFDRHMTQIYNHFAWPPYREHLCLVAPTVLAEAANMPTGKFKGWAQSAVQRFDQPVVQPQMTERKQMAAKAKAAPASASTQEQRIIQLGAFTGHKRAETAWKTISSRLNEIRQFSPSYEKVPGRTELVRLRVKGNMSDTDAVRMCALAAASGFECFPVHG